MNNLLVALGAGVIALLFAAWTARRVLAEDEGTDTMKTIARAIQEGAAAFLRREYTFLSVFVVIVAVALAVFVDYDVLDRFGPQHGELTDVPRTAAAYILGAISSALTGYVGM